MAGAGQAPHIFSIPPGVPSARTLISGILERHGRDPLALAGLLVFVPTRRAVRTLRETFAAELGGAALGPDIRALGDASEEEWAFDPAAENLDLAPAIAPLCRHLLLATLVRRWHQARGRPAPFAQSLHQAVELARLLDEAITQGADLAQIDTLVDEASLTKHWREVRSFLGIIGKEWPTILAAQKSIEPAAKRNRQLAAMAAQLGAQPERPVIAAGSTGSIPATAELLKTIAYMPQGAVVLPGLDSCLDGESWAQLDHAHAQYGLRHVLKHLGAEREDVRPWTNITENAERAARTRYLSESLRPPPTTDAWRALVDRDGKSLAPALDKLALIEASDPREEALVIALALREALETPGRRAALVTPDRNLARRVAAELMRWDISIDDSAGMKLSHTPPGSFLILLARAAAERFAPVSLLALLKHPLAAGGEAPASFRHMTRALERAVLRGLRPEPGLEGIAAALARKGETHSRLIGWFASLQENLAPFAAAMAKPSLSLLDLAKAHIAAAEALASTDPKKKDGAERLWRGPAGEAAAKLLADLMQDGKDVTLDPAEHYAELFRDLAEARAVRPPYGRHPRLAILGPLEARLQDFDLTVLGGLNEGAWPASATTDPWLSRPMRISLGLEPPERRIGLAAHDFAMLAAGPDVVLTRALRQDGAPTTASRWVLRLTQLAKGLGLGVETMARPRLLALARALDDGAKDQRIARPAPRPPVEARPRKLRVTEIETWVRDPYAIYARHVLGLRPLDPIDAEPGPRERGTAIHAALEKFLKEHPDALPDDGFALLCRFGAEAFDTAGASEAVRALWQPRFVRAARWFLDYETARRAVQSRRMAEITGELTLTVNGKPFALRGRADRIDIHPDGSADVLDYKSGGRLPGHKEVNALLNMQLPLEAVLLRHGAFEGIEAEHIRALIYIQLTGGDPPGLERIIDADEGPDALVAKALAALIKMVANYDDASRPYLSRVLVHKTTDTGDYDHLARVREWGTLGEAET
jgi:ATP-dependent helicase/nuclease subunit B